jgi:predicted metalloendopeptidase
MDHMVKMFTLLGDTDDKAVAEANDVMQIETALAKGSMDRVEMRDPAKRYHMMTVAELQKLSPNYDWTVYLDGIGMPQVKTSTSAPGLCDHGERGAEHAAAAGDQELPALARAARCRSAALQAV